MRLASGRVQSPRVICGLITVVSALFVGAPVAAGIEQPPAALPEPAPSQWTKVLDDEFNGTALNSTIWRRYGETSDWPGHNGIGLRVARAVSVHDGIADITATPARQTATGELESGGFTARSGYQYIYGRYEMTIKTEGGAGTMSGLSMLWNSDTTAHPGCDGESDVYETGTSRDDFQTFLHWEPVSGPTANCSDASTQDSCDHNFDPRRWHHVVLEWEPARYAVYVDGGLSCTITNAAHIPDWKQRLTFQFDAFNESLASAAHLEIARAKVYVRPG
jgi:beta-glucanase (GH16 family)